MKAGFLLLSASLALVPQPAAADDDGRCDSAGPFRAGEAYPEELATCETLVHWAERAPKTDNRVTLGIKGKLTGVHSDGVMAYLLMCEPAAVQVMCVTYSTNGHVAGDVWSSAAATAGWTTTTSCWTPAWRPPSSRRSGGLLRSR